jgi:hypothetical protein
MVKLGDPKRSCRECEAHYSGSAVNIKRDHRKIMEAHEAAWERKYTAATEGSAQRESRIAELQKEIKGYVDAIAAGEVDAELGVHNREAVDRTKTLTMRQRTQDAYYARDLAMNSIAIIVYSKDARVLDPVIDIYTKWERKQVELMKTDRDHGLSRDHPKADDSVARYWRGRSAVRS